MKTRKPRQTILTTTIAAIAVTGIFATPSASAANLYWDGATPTGAPGGGAGNWDLALTNWDTSYAGADVAWVNANKDTAVFGGTFGTATLTENVTVGGLRFDTTGYIIDGETNTKILTFADGNNSIIFNGNTTAATINGTVAGTASANVSLSFAPGQFSGGVLLSGGTLTLGLTSTAGWGGTTTINPNMTLSLSGANRGLSSTSGITLNGGGITLTNTNSTQAAFNRVNDSAGITSNGGTFTYTNTAGADTGVGRVYAETIGAVDLVRGQTNFVLTNNQNGGGTPANSQTLTLAASGNGLTRTGATNTSVVTFSSGGTGLSGLNTTTNRIVVTGASTTSGWVSGATSNPIIGPWATAGISATNQNDYAVYNGNQVVAANTIHSTQTNWTDATKAYMFNGQSAVGGTVLTATRNLTGLNLNTFTTNTGGTGTDTSTDRVAWANNSFVEGTPFVALGTVPTGLTSGLIYYARNPVGGAGGSFQVSSSPTGPIIDLTSTSGITAIAPGVGVSSGNNLGTTGILATSGTTHVIASSTGTGGVVTLPSPTSAALYVSTVGAGAANVNIQVPITNNGAGVLTLVKSGVGGGGGGQGVLTLGGNNTFTGGLVLNAGQVLITGPQSFTGGVTLNGGFFGGSSAGQGISAAALNNNAVAANGLSAFLIAPGETLSTSSTITVNSTGILDIGVANGGIVTVPGVVSGTGTLVMSGNNVNAGQTIRLTNTANTFTGNITFPGNNGGAGNGPTLSVVSIGDGGKVTIGYNTGDLRQFALDSAATAPLTFSANGRQFELVGPSGNASPTIANNSAQAFTINSNLLVSGALGTRTLALRGTGIGLSTFGGKIENGSLTSLAITKTEAGTWNLTNTGNTFTGGTTVSAGILRFASGALGSTGTINANGGTLQWGAGNTENISSRLAMGTGTTTLDTNGNDVVFTNAIGTAVTSGALVKTGSGTLTLQATNNYTGTTTVNMGTLALDYTAVASKLADGAALILGGGTVDLKNGGSSHTEIVSATTLTNATGSYVTRTSGTSVLQMGTITNNTGTVNFGAPSIATTNNTNNVTTGILGTWATVGGDWAINSTNAANGPITAYSAYTDVTRLESGTKVIPNTLAANVRIIEGTGVSPANLTLAATDTSINTLNQSISGGTSAVTIAMAAQTLRTSGILQGPTAGSLTVGVAGGSVAVSGTLTALSGGSLTFTNNSANDMVINSVLAANGANTYIKTGTGTLVLAGDSTFTGTFTIQDGTVKAGKNATSGSVGPLGSGSFYTLANKSTAILDTNGFNLQIGRLEGGGSLGGNVVLSSTKTLTVGNNSGTYNGIISGSGGNITYGGSNTATYTSAHTYTGVTTFTGTTGLLTNSIADGGIASGIGASSNVASNLVFNGGSLRYNGTANASTDRRFTLQGNGGFGVYSTGALNLTSTTAIAHGGNVAAKTFLLAGNGAGGGTLAAAITDSGTGANITGINLGFSNSGNSGANWTLTNANNTFSGTILHSATNYAGGMFSYASAGGSNPITFNQTASPGTGGISYIGATDKTMTGAITANALSTGSITFDASGAGAVNYSNAASMGVGGASGNKGLVLSGTNTGNNILAAGWSNNTAGGAATITKNGASRWTLSGTNNYSGLTLVNAGTLQFAKQASLYNGTSASWTAANINVKAGAALAVNVDSTGTAGFDATNLNTLLGNISVANTAAQGLQAGATLGFDTSTATGASFTQGNAIANSTGANGGAIGLTKLGTGTLILDKANTYTGATAVNAGTLLVSGSISGSTTTVNTGGTLAGSGTTGAVTLNGGTIAPGSSPGILNTGNFTFSSGAATFEINGATAGSGYDQLNVNGAVSFTANIAFTISLGYTPAPNQAFTLINNDSTDAITLNGFGFAVGANQLTEGEQFTASGQDFTITYVGGTDNNDVVLSAVPEPGSALMLAGGLATLLGFRRRRVNA